MRLKPIVTMARFTVLEAWRTRLLLLFVVVLALISGMAFLLEQLAITESARLQIAFAAAATRFAAVFVLTLHILTSITREFNDKGLELILSFDLPRSHYILGRLFGFLLIATLLALMASVPQLILAPPVAALQWSLSLALELAIVAALSLFCVVTFAQLMPSASFVLGFYLLARALSAIRIMSDTPLTGGNTLSHQVMALLVDTLGLALPALDHYAQTTWLIDVGGGWSVLGANVVQTMLYVVLLGAATMFDFYRRNL